MDARGSLTPYLERLKDGLSGKLEIIYQGSNELYRSYQDLPSERKRQIGQGVLSAALYVASLVSGNHIGIYAQSLIPIADELYTTASNLYPAAKRGELGREDLGRVRELGDRLYKEILPVLVQLISDKKEQPTRKTRPRNPSTVTQGVMATITGLSILGLGVSFRMGTEITGKVGSITVINLPFMIIFSFILIMSGIYLVKRKSN